MKTRVEVVTKSPVLSTVVEVRPKDDNDVPGVKNNLAEPEYDFLSTQPAEVVDETYKVQANVSHRFLVLILSTNTPFNTSKQFTSIY